MIIAVLNQKGGVGKTTLAVHFSAALALMDRTVLMVDADPQGSALDWAASRRTEPLFAVIGLPRGNLHREIPEHAKHYDTIVIDGPPRVNELTRSAMMASDQVIIPVQPSPYDVWAAGETVSLVQEAQVFRPELKVAFVVSRKIVNTAIGRDVTKALAGFSIRVLRTEICQRVAFAESAADGRTVLESAPDSLASREIRALVQELMADNEEFHHDEKTGRYQSTAEG